MNYSLFVKTEEEIQMEQQEQKDKYAKLKEYAEKNQWVLLQSIYYDRSGYYYDKKNGDLYKFYYGSDNPRFVIDNDPEIFKANGLKAIKSFEPFGF
jgi:hypothetical protein